MENYAETVSVSCIGMGRPKRVRRYYLEKILERELRFFTHGRRVTLEKQRAPRMLLSAAAMARRARAKAALVAWVPRGRSVTWNKECSMDVDVEYAAEWFWGAS